MTARGAIALPSARDGFHLRVPARARSLLAGALARAAFVTLAALAALLVLLAASGSSFLTPTTGPLYFPSWMAGPLGGVWSRGPISEQALHWEVSAILAGMYLAYLMTILLSARVRARWVLATVLAVHLVFLLAPPLQYTDVFNYINYARMGVVHHLDPYGTIPMLEPHADPTFTLSNWHWLLSPYGPLFTLATYALVPLGVPGSFWAIKVLVCASSLGMLALVWRCALLLGRDPVKAIALVGLNPIVLMWGLGADHNDVLMVAPMVLCVYLLLRARVTAPTAAPAVGRLRYEHLAAAALIAAVGVKASAAVLIPVAFVAAPHRRAFAVGLVLAAAAMSLASVVAFGAHLPGLGIQTSLVTDVGPANLLGWSLGQGGETATLHTILGIAAGLIVLLSAIRAGRAGKDWLALAGVSLLAVWLTTSWFTPWYLIWILPFAALAARPRLTICVLAIGVYLLVAFGPEITPLLQALHFNPNGSPLGQKHYHQNITLAR